MHVSQPIDVGSVLSGRYQVTESVLSSAEGDLVLGGVDQVLNRTVSIMVASVENSSQLATSAREIAMGEDRKSTRLNSSHVKISYAVFCLKKKINTKIQRL